MDLSEKPRWVRVATGMALAIACMALYRVPGGQWLGPIGSMLTVVWAMRHSPSSRWLRMLWLWWSICLFALVTMWVLTSAQSLELDLQKQMERLTMLLTTGFKSLQVHQLEILLGGPASPLEGVRYKTGWQFQPFLDTKRDAWLPIAADGNLTNVKWYFTRPLDASYQHEYGYLVVVAPAGGAVGMNLNDVYQQWLPMYCRRAGWDALVEASRVSLEHKLQTGEPPRYHWTLGFGQNGSQAPGPSNHWTTQLNTFLDMKNQPMDRIELTVRGDMTIYSGLQRRAGWLGMGAIFMATFAGTIVLVGRGVRRELELAQARSNFTAMVSHELRTPVAALRLHTDMLEHHLIESPEEVENSYRAIGEQTRRLQHLIETVLDLAKIERRVKVFDLAPGSLNDVVTDAIERLGTSGVSLTLQPELPAAMVDREAATQVVVNLVQNAIRYAQDVSVTTSADQKWVRVQVLDRGPGIPRKLRAHIFDPYVRASNEGKGVGLGLALVRGYMEGHRGSVSVRARQGGGTIMTAQFRQVSKLELKRVVYEDEDR